MVDAQHHQFTIINGYANPVDDEVRHARHSLFEGAVHKPRVPQPRENRKQRECLADTVDHALRRVFTRRTRLGRQ